MIISPGSIILTQLLPGQGGFSGFYIGLFILIVVKILSLDCFVLWFFLFWTMPPLSGILIWLKTSNSWSQFKHLLVVLLLVVGQPQAMFCCNYVILSPCLYVVLCLNLHFCISVFVTLPLYVMIFCFIEFLVVVDYITYS